MDNQGYYAILAVSQKANFQEIKKSYRRLAKNITLTETNPPMQKRRSKKLIKHSKFYLIGRKENNTI
jgi:DnaJ domain